MESGVGWRVIEEIGGTLKAGGLEFALMVGWELP